MTASVGDQLSQPFALSSKLEGGWGSEVRLECRYHVPAGLGVFGLVIIIRKDSDVEAHCERSPLLPQEEITGSISQAIVVFCRIL